MNRPRADLVYSACFAYFIVLAFVLWQHNSLAQGGRATGGGGNHAVIQIAGAQRFLVEDPRVSLDAGRYKKIPVMGGVTKHEGSFFLGSKYFPKSIYKEKSPGVHVAALFRTY